MINGNDLAYPSTELDMDSFEPIKEHNGLTKREYFAAMAMQGILTNSLLSTDLESIESIAGLAVVHADLLIKALNK